ncbi:MAG: hypothetical protein SGI86_07535 [Deltaproteobacteria bacterium]|nr:hypothetical protein [Deltaproteobacteria bacterium]
MRRLAVGTMLALLAAMGASACSVTQPVVTPRYRIQAIDFWDVKKVGLKDGEASQITIGQYSGAVIDDGSGATSGAVYDSRTAEVDARVYAWPDADSAIPAVDVALRLLRNGGELQLSEHSVVATTPFECGKLQRKYRHLGQTLASVDLVKWPGWRTIVVGVRGQGSLLAVIGRVEFQQDPNRYCHNLNNLQVQTQNLLDGLELIAPATR